MKIKTDQCIHSRRLGSLGLGASGSVITCMQMKMINIGGRRLNHDKKGKNLMHACKIYITRV